MANIRTRLRNFFAQFPQAAFKFRKFWNKEPNAAHCFDMMEFIFLLGGIRCESTDDLIRRIYHLIRFLAGFQFIVAWWKLVEQWSIGDDITLLFWYGLMAVALTKSIFNSHLINRYAGLLRKLQNFICSQKINSLDLQHDCARRQKFHQFVIKFLKLFILVLLSQQQLMLIPIDGRDEQFSAPLVWNQFGPFVNTAANFGFRFMFASIWLGKYFCCIVTCLLVLIGLKTEMHILVQKFADINQRVEFLINNGDLASRNRIELLRSHASFWDTMNKKIPKALKQHLELLEIFFTIRPFIGTAFMVRYYFSLCFTGALLFLAFRIGVVFWFVVIVGNVLMSLAEIFLWCYLIDSFQDARQSIGEIAFDISTKLPYCPEHHFDYVRTRTDLIIIGLNTYHGKPMKCAGIFVINMNVFVNMANTVYTVVTFLLNVS